MTPAEPPGFSVESVDVVSDALGGRVREVVFTGGTAFFAVAGALKLIAVDAFRAQLTEYALLPPRVVPLASVALPLVELSAAALAVPLLSVSRRSVEAAVAIEPWDGGSRRSTSGSLNWPLARRTGERGRRAPACGSA